MLYRVDLISFFEYLIIKLYLFLFLLTTLLGNIKFRRLLEKHYDAYTNADDADKLVLVDYLSHQMNTTLGVRFLKSISVNSNTTNNHWEIVTDQKMIRSKFYQAFRNLRASYRRMELQQQQQQCQTKAVTTL